MGCSPKPAAAMRLPSGLQARVATMPGLGAHGPPSTATSRAERPEPCVTSAGAQPAFRAQTKAMTSREAAVRNAPAHCGRPRRCGTSLRAALG